jgi:hypothetical protein
MSTLRVDNITDELGTGAPEFPNGLTSNGDVGIGTTTPNAKLEVLGGRLRINNTSDPGIEIANAGVVKGYVFHDTAGDVVTIRHASNTSGISVNSSGNIGIGTSAPNYQLTIQGTGQETANLTDAGNKGGSLYLKATAIGSGSGGAVLFGTSFGNQTPFAAIKGFVVDGANNTIGRLVFSTRNAVGDTSLTERMLIADNGKVGIGTSDPDQLMTINSVNTTTNSLVSYKQGGTTYGYTGLGSDNKMRIQGVGAALEIQTTTAQAITFNVNGTIRVTIGTTGVVTIANLAGSGSRAVNASATGVLSAASDSRLKQEVPTAPIPGLAEIMQLEPKAYKWIDDIEKRGEDAAVEIGFFANDVKDIIPSAAPMGNDGYYGFYDRAVIAALTKAVQEQQKMIQDLQADIAAMQP